MAWGVVTVNREAEPGLTILARQFPAMVMTGPRTSGKSTVFQKVYPQLPCNPLASPAVRAIARQYPRGFLRQFPQGAVLGELQKWARITS